MPQVVVEGAKMSFLFSWAAICLALKTGADCQMLNEHSFHQLFMCCRRSSTRVCYKRAEHATKLPEQAELEPGEYETACKEPKPVREAAQVN